MLQSNVINERYSASDIESITNKLRELFGERPSGTSCFGWLDAGVQDLGGEIMVAFDDSAESLRVEKNKFTIFISPITSPARDNFTIGHELGHYFLHTNIENIGDQPVLFSRYGLGAAEAEANRFAAELLMPKSEFLEKAKEFNNNEFLLASHFDVSVSATRVRLTSLNII